MTEEVINEIQSLIQYYFLYSCIVSQIDIEAPEIYKALIHRKASINRRHYFPLDHIEKVLEINSIQIVTNIGGKSYNPMKESSLLYCNKCNNSSKDCIEKA